ncbi:MAG TPA: DNA repair protein RadC [Myxococcaceae bacterium]|nr:DNA repair protein RadC [Myxococcaceae bacterium]
MESTVEDEPGTGAQEAARERLLRSGAEGLADVELLALLFGPLADGLGSLAERLLEAGGGLRGLLSLEPHELCARGGLGPDRAAQVLAAVELARRAQIQAERRPCLRSPDEVQRYLSPRLAVRGKEQFRVLCFNTRNVLLADIVVAQGTVDSCPVDPREVYRAALSARASAIVLAHNHPSGDPTPSLSDLDLTRQLVDAGRTLGIRVLDHVIIADGRYSSFLQARLLDAEGAWTGAGASEPSLGRPRGPLRWTP